MTSQAMTETGWAIYTPTSKKDDKITHYQVFGERSSGTNFVKRLIGRNTVLKPIEDLGWKHGFPHMTAIPSHVMIVGVMRDARTWAQSMHAKPWHCPAALQALPFSEFLRADWQTIADKKRYFPQVAEHGGVGQMLQHDRHPLTGAVFRNLFLLRRAKLQALLSFENRDCRFTLCRMEAVQANPEAFLDALQTGLKLPQPEQAYRPVVKRLGSKFQAAIEPRPQTPEKVSYPDLSFLRSQIDLAQEARLGYDYTE